MTTYFRTSLPPCLVRYLLQNAHVTEAIIAIRPEVPHRGNLATYWKMSNGLWYR